MWQSQLRNGIFKNGRNVKYISVKYNFLVLIGLHFTLIDVFHTVLAGVNQFIHFECFFCVLAVYCVYLNILYREHDLPCYMYIIVGDYIQMFIILIKI